MIFDTILSNEEDVIEEQFDWLVQWYVDIDRIQYIHDSIYIDYRSDMLNRLEE
jgi:hypothetical protein